MTPKPDIVWIDIREEAKANWEEIAGSDHSHFPVCDGSLDSPLGLISVKRIWMRLVAGQIVDLKASMVSPLFIPESARVHTLLELFKQHHRHTALVTDEFGAVCGIVNQIDVLETIVGFIPTLDERAEETLVRREDGSYLIDGTYGIEDFKRKFELDLLDGESEGDFKTLGGYVLMHFGRIPRASDHFARQGFRFEVMDMDGRRVDKLLVVPLPKNDPGRIPHTPPS
jgi:putative hemolysin